MKALYSVDLVLFEFGKLHLSLSSKVLMSFLSFSTLSKVTVSFNTSNLGFGVLNCLTFESNDHIFLYNGDHIVQRVVFSSVGVLSSLIR